MTLADWLSRLEKLHFKSIDMGLERVHQAAQRLGVIEHNSFVFTIAGTNGKGSTTTFISKALLASGYSVGLYTSPHLVRFNERILINGEECEDQLLIEAFEAIETKRGDISLTYFEFTTLAAAWIFQRSNLDAWVLEVGLGGRLDAVNIWDPDIAVVTSIDLDHQQWLGPDRATIGIEKIGIGRPGRPLVMGDPHPPQATVDAAHALGVRLFQRNQEFYCVADTQSWQAVVMDPEHGSARTLKQLPYPKLYLDNVLSALQALQISPFKIAEEPLRKLVGEARLVGRLQQISEKPAIMLDVGHNPHAARALRSTLLAGQYRKIHCVVGMLADKAVSDTLLELLSVIDLWYPVNADSPRALPAAKIRQMLLDMGAMVGVGSSHPGVCCNHLKGKAAESDLIVVFGSFYTVSEVIQYSDLR